MKLPIIITAGMLTAAIAYNAYALTCGAQPSCDSLGYTYTGSTSDCVNTPMKCPFNSSYFNCVKKADIFFQFKLNWAGATDISDMSNWSAYQNGIIIGHAHDKRNVGVLSILTIKQ